MTLTLTLSAAAQQTLLAALLAATPKTGKLTVAGKEPVECVKPQVELITTVNGDALGTGKALAVTATSCKDTDCHACGGYIGTAPITPDGKLVGRPSANLEYGQWGKVDGKPSLVSLGPKAIGLRFDGQGMGQGMISAGASIFLVRPSGELAQVFQAFEAIDNGPAECDPKGRWEAPPEHRQPCMKKTIAITVSPTHATDGMQDIEVMIKGKDLDYQKKRLVNVDRVDRYVWNGLIYQLPK